MKILEDVQYTLEEMYFCLYLTENEHYIVQDQLALKCLCEGWKLMYYRELNEGHVPMYREVKIFGHRSMFERYMNQTGLVDHIRRNPHK